MEVVITEQFARDQRRFASQPAVLADLAIAAAELSRGVLDSPLLQTAGVDGAPRGVMTSRAGLDHRIGWFKHNGSAVLLLLDRDREAARRTRKLAVDLDAGRTAVVASHDIETVFTRPLEDWMVLLEGEQVAAVERRFAGPACITGGAGTGKTVVGVHRAARLAGEGRNVLFTTSARPFPSAVEAMYRRLASEATPNVSFSGIDAYALSTIPRATSRLAPKRADAAFEDAWERSSRRRRSALQRHGLDKHWCRGEIASQIKGRGLSARDRPVYVDSPARAAIWSLYLVYERCLRARNTIDHADVQRIARDHVRAYGDPHGYDAVIVDNADDLTPIGRELVAAIAGTREDGLLLIGDRQRGGRRVTLRHDHRHTREIVALADAVVAGFAERVEVERSGEPVVLRRFGGLEEHDADLDGVLLRLSARPDTGRGDLGVLVADPRQAEHYAVRLAHLEAVDVTTFRRARPLEFKHVLVARADLETTPRELFVAVTRARDSVWIGSVGEPSVAGLGFRPAGGD